jgi:hypothetical protein
MIERIFGTRIVPSGLCAALAAGMVAPAVAAENGDRCTDVTANAPQAQIAATSKRLPGARGPLGCPSSPARDGSQMFEQGTISQPHERPDTTIASYLLGGRLHLSMTSVGLAVPRYQIAMETADGSVRRFWTFGAGSSASFLADLPEGTGSSFRVKLFACQENVTPFSSDTLVCDRRDEATAVSAPLELAMDPSSPRVSPTGAVALRH